MKEKYLDYSAFNKDMSMDEIAELTLKNYETIERFYPEDIPNDECKYAIISGFLMSAEDFKIKGNFCKLLETYTEEIYLWKNGMNNIQFVSKAKENLKKLESWKTFGYLMELSFAFCKQFEITADEVNYNWVYRFDPNLKLDEQDIYKYYSVYNINSGIYITKDNLPKILRIFFLLDNDSIFLHSLINFYNSMNVSYTCLICELSKSDFKMHSSHEPKIWERLSMLNNYMVAVVLAYKSVELILGNPPIKEKAKSKERFLERWYGKININHDDIFYKSETSYFDYFFEFKHLRNSSAHAEFNGVFEMKRTQSIKAQCFAAEIVFSYVEKNIHFIRNILDTYNPNQDVLNDINIE